MKKIALVLFLLFNLCVPAYAVNFVEIRRTDNALIYVDIDSIELRKTNNDEYVVAWTKWIYRGDRAKELSKEYKIDVDYLISFDAYNKNYKQVQTLSEYMYDKKSQIVHSGSWPFQALEYIEATPGTYGETMYDFVMNYYNQNKK